MISLGVDPDQLAASGRTVEEHRDIALALKVDPKGSPSVKLDFESGDFDGWSVRRLSQPYSAVIQSDVVRSGRNACRFEIRAGDMISGGLRAELRDWYNAPFETETAYGFSTFLPHDFAPPPGASIVLAQWHDQAELGDPAGKPPLALRYMDGALRFTGAFANVASQNPERLYVFHEEHDIRHGQWLDFAFVIRWSKLRDSTIQTYLNGAPRFDFAGPLGYRNQMKGPYFKLGVYTSDEIDAPLVVYHDNYSRAGGLDAVDPSRLYPKRDAAL